MLTIKAEAAPGAEIQQTFKEAIIIAKKLNCWVDFNFNGVQCMASPEGSDEKGAAAYHKAIQSERTYKFAVS